MEKIVKLFASLVERIGFEGALAFFLFLFMVWFVRYVYNKQERIFIRELERHVEEKKELQRILVSYIPSSLSRELNQVEAKETKDE